MTQKTIFAGLVFDEQDRLVESATVGTDAFYVIDDNGFRRHVPAESIDRYVMAFFIEQLQNNKELAIEQTLRMMGQDDLFTKAAVEASIRNINMDEILRQGLPEQARDMLGMMGFRIVVNYHGEVLAIIPPATSDSDDWD